MKKVALLTSSIFILIALNFSVYQKEQILEHGETILLELAPVDPRSLMQGDYMRLRYTIEQKIRSNSNKNAAKNGRLVVRADDRNVAQFIRFYDGEEPHIDEKLIRYTGGRTAKVAPNSFMFQEGKAELYQDAKYGIFKFNGTKNYLLVGLADSNRVPITSNNKK